MKKRIDPTKILGVLLILGCFFTALAIQTKVSLEKNPKPNPTEIPITKLKDGDIIFQTTESRQCKAIQLATKSVYSHVGILFQRNSEWMVLEAVQPVKYTPLKKWVANGKNGHYVVKRINHRDSLLNNKVLKKMKQIGKGYVGKNYDIYFGWSDDKIYCSELVWKMYKNGAKVEVGKIQQLKDFDLSEGIVKEIVEERYGDDIPWEEKVISPASIFNASNLSTVTKN